MIKKAKKHKEKAVILLSGGLDSATALYFARQKGYSLTALIFDYGQRHIKEIKCAKRLASLNKVGHYLLKINLSWTKSSLTNCCIKTPFNRNLNEKLVPKTYVSGRNIIFLSYAISLAESIGAMKIFFGAHIQDYSGYPDCRPKFLKSFEQSANLGMKNNSIKIITPLINKSKKEIIQLGLDLGVPFEYTWSCYQGVKSPCEKCDSCRYRMKAFTDLGLRDPLLD